MQRLKTVVLALSALCVVAALTASSAFATLPQLLTAAGALVEKESFTGESGKTALVTLKLSEVTCAKSTAEGELIENTSAKGFLGPFHITFKECTSKTALGTATCTGASDTSGVILTLGEAHLVYDSLTTLGVGVLFLISLFHFTCTLFGVNELVLVEGSVICLIKPINTLAKHFEIICEEILKENKPTGDPKEPTYWNGSGVEQKTSLLTNVGETSFESSAENGTGLILTTLEVKIDG
jgi:hypothetical protein